jgi:hypothetical protein
VLDSHLLNYLKSTARRTLHRFISPFLVRQESHDFALREEDRPDEEVLRLRGLG